MNIFRKLKNSLSALTGSVSYNNVPVEMIVATYRPAYKDPYVQISLQKELICSTMSHQEYLAKLRKSLSYVWTDGYESKTWIKRPCRYLGIRILPNFILHETIACGHGWNEYGVRLLAKKCKARLLSPKEFQLVLELWKDLSDMREKAGDAPLERGLTWTILSQAETNSDKTSELYSLCGMDGKVIWWSEFDDEGNALFSVE